MIVIDLEAVNRLMVLGLGIAILIALVLAFRAGWHRRK